MGVRHTETSLIIWSEAPPVKAAGDQEKQKNAAQAAAALFNADEFYDAGDKGCASGPMDEIAAIVRGMQAGQTLEVHATDATVAVDLTAWCRMTGHRLIEQQGSHYLIQHK